MDSGSFHIHIEATDAEFISAFREIFGVDPIPVYPEMIPTDQIKVPDPNPMAMPSSKLIWLGDV
jgi:hypothetical protein